MQLNSQKIQEYQPCRNDDQKCLDYNRSCALTEEESIRQECLSYHLFCSIARNDIEIVRSIIGNYADVNVFAFGFKDLPDDKSCPINNKYSWSSTETLDGEVSINPLMLAAYVGNKNIINLLLRNGARRGALDKYGSTLFHYVGSSEVVNLLTNLDIGINIKNEFGHTPLHEVIRSLNKKKNDNNAIKKIENTIIRLIEMGADISSTDDYRYTPLHYATHFNNIRITEFILKEIAQQYFNPIVDPIVRQYFNPRDEGGEAPLHKAAYNGNLEMVDILIKNKADINAQNKHGNTPLHMAIIGGKGRAEDIVRLLLKEGAIITIKNKSGMTPLDLARDYEKNNLMRRRINYTNIINLLEEQMTTTKPIISSTIATMAKSTTYSLTAESPLDIKSTMKTIRESNRRNGYTEEAISSTTTHLLEKEGRRVSRSIRQRALLDTENIVNKVKNIEGKGYKNSNNVMGMLLFFGVVSFLLLMKIFITKENRKATNNDNVLSGVVISRVILNKDATKQI